MADEKGYGAMETGTPPRPLIVSMDTLAQECARLAADLAVVQAAVRALAGQGLGPIPATGTRTRAPLDGPSGGGTSAALGAAVEALPNGVAHGKGAAALTVEGTDGADGVAARGGNGGAAIRVTAMDGAVGVQVHADRGPGIRVQSAGSGLQIESVGAPGIYAEATDAAAVVASSVGAHGVHALGGGVTGGLGTSPRPCGVFAEGGSGDGVYATGEDVAVRGISLSGYGASFAGGAAPLHLAPAETIGAPATGAHRQGALFMDAGGALWLCTASGTPGTWGRIMVR